MIQDQASDGCTISFDFLIGRTESEAFEMVQDHGFSPRIVARDRMSMIVTRDHRTDRVNLRISDNRVTSWYIG